MKKIVLFVLDLLSIGLLAGAYLVQLFTVRKLGMNRWVVYHQMKAKEALPVEWLKYLAPLVMALLIFLLWKTFQAKRKKGFVTWLLMILLTLEGAFYLFFTILMNQRSIRAYYLVLPLIGLSACFLWFRSLLQVLGHEK